MLRRRILALFITIAACTALTAGSAGLASASTHQPLVQHGARHGEPSRVRTLRESPEMKEGQVSAENPQIPQQPYDCDFTVNQSINRVVSTASAWLHTCVNVDYCTQVADLQWKDPGGTFITIAEGGQTHGCTGQKSVASIDCAASQNINEYRGEGIFTFVSDFGDQVGPFTEYTGAGSYLTIC